MLCSRLLSVRNGLLGAALLSSGLSNAQVFSSSAIQDAASRGYIRYYALPSGTYATNSAYMGSSYVVLAYTSYRGNTSTDAKLVSNIRATLSSGSEPAGVGGYISQHELRFAVAVALAKRTPRIWSRFTDRERSQLDLIMKAITVGNAYSCSSKNPEILQRKSPVRNLVSDQMWWKNAPNFRNACPASVMTGYLYLGSRAFNDLMENFDKAAFASQARSLGLNRVYEAYRTNGPGGPLGARPRAVDVQNAVKDWRWAMNGQPVTAMIANTTFMVDGAFNKVVEAGVDGGRGISYRGERRGRIMRNASSVPNLGRMGMANELDTVDAGGVRSAMSYTVAGTRIVLDFLLLLSTTNPAPNAALSSALERMNVGMIDIRYKAANGYYSYSKGGGTSNNEDWVPSTYHRTWGMEYTLSQWFDVLRPLYDVRCGSLQSCQR